MIAPFFARIAAHRFRDRLRRGRAGGLMLTAAVALGACAGPVGQTGDSDPLEPFNRAVFTINDAADTIVVRPVAVAYRDVVPTPLKDGVRNVLRNLRTPLILANEALQGDWEGVDVAATRFFVNSTIGLGGWIDIAGEHLDKPFQGEDFGQTLAVWGVDSGPYLVLPLLGPSTIRDTGGIAVEMASDPFNNLWDEGLLDDVDGAGIGRVGLTVIDTRARNLDTLDELRRSSVDYYAAVRSLYLQNRRSEINDGEGGPTLEIPDYEDLPGTQGGDGQDGGQDGGQDTGQGDGPEQTSRALPADPAAPAAARRGTAAAARLPDAPAPLLRSVSQLPPLELDLPPVAR